MGATSLFLLDFAARDRPAATLAKCWLARVLLNYDAGVYDVALDWSLVPGRQSLASVQAALCGVPLDSAMPRYRAQQ